ncbi:MazG-related protein [Neptunomonas sp.]|uniref:nucleotidyltransferase domain-containing protein n=1 Tax=Neptunomonas sp. TaxID=1971898 RepID=UPI0025EA88CA|nr:MazG-related protein [Neptunomonas sp.]
MSDRVKVALEWLNNLLESQQVAYQIVGGLAATIHGGSREVADIDLYIKKADAAKVLSEVTPYISKPLTHCVEGSWDLEYFQLIYQSQKIEIGLFPGTKIQSSENGSWYELHTDFSASVVKSYLGMEVPVIPIPELISYKRLLGREVDHIDVQELLQVSAL